MPMHPSAHAVRQSFLDFFREKDHTIVASAPIVLPSDPSLLFVNAGMNPFKDIFLGVRRSESPRVADTQKCIRVSGKHNDLEAVGRDTYHHTFFEMLGNWSFGDYYKKEAIAWAWEWLTGVWSLPRDRLWVTVFHEDDEAATLWREHSDVAAGHILRFGRDDNFWEMGDTGPCGPCSEIHIDISGAGDLGPDQVNAGHPELIEIWNLVFIQHTRRADGTLEDLPEKHVDTGMGLERIAAVLQGCRSNYDTDLFRPLIDAVAERSGQRYEGEAAVAMRVIADHLRALAFAIADGVVPSNDGRGYVLRRLLRRAARFGRLLGLKEPFLGSLMPVLEEPMAPVFPELAQRRDLIRRTLRAEEEAFAATLDRGLELFAQAAESARAGGRDVFPGEEAFRLYDTYGFPLDLTGMMAAERGLRVDVERFEALMQAQRARARAARGGPGGIHPDLLARWASEGKRSAFTGYDRLQDEAVIEALVDAEGKAFVAELGQDQEGYLLLSQTPFYGEAGGQVGDRGSVTAQGVHFEVEDTLKPADGLLLHRGRVRQGRLAAGDRVQATVEEERRRQIMRHHTGTHLLQNALRAELGTDLRQAGSYVAPDRLRFDFNHFEALSHDVLNAVERRVNEAIRRNVEVRAYTMNLKDVPGSGIIAVFDEQYGETVRVLDIGGFSRELCGGTHVSRTGDIGLLRIVAESSIASGVRRIEAVCGSAAFEWSQREHGLLQELGQRLSVPVDALPERLDALLAEQRRLEKALRHSRAQLAAAEAGALLGKARKIGDMLLLAAEIEADAPDALPVMGERLRQEIHSGVVLLGASVAGKALLYAAVTPDLAGRVHAGKLVGAVARAIGGGGGGKPDRAQAGARDGRRVPEALAAAPALLEAMQAGPG